MNFVYVFLVWHLFFLVMKFFLFLIRYLDQKFSRTLTLTIIGGIIFILVFFKPMLYLLGQQFRLLFLASGHFLGGYSEDVRNIAISAICIGNVILFTLMHMMARKSKNLLFKLFYDVNFPNIESKRRF